MFLPANYKGFARSKRGTSVPCTFLLSEWNEEMKKWEARGKRVPATYICFRIGADETDIKGLFPIKSGRPSDTLFSSGNGVRKKKTTGRMLLSLTSSSDPVHNGIVPVKCDG